MRISWRKMIFFFFFGLLFGIQFSMIHATIYCQSFPILSYGALDLPGALIYGKVLKNYPDNSVQIEIIEILDGETNSNLIHVIVWTDEHHEVSLPLKVGSEWIFFAWREEGESMKYRSGGPCGTDWIEVSSNKVTGRIKSLDKETMNLLEFKNMVKEKIQTRENNESNQ